MSSSSSSSSVKPNTSAPKSSSRGSLMDTIWQVDEDISKPIFEMSLPHTVEYILSIPGNLFGLVPSILIGPLWIMIVLGDSAPPLPLTIVTCALTLGYLYAWTQFVLMGDSRWMKKYLTANKLYFVSAAVSGVICYTQSTLENPQLLSLSLYPSIVWMLSIMITLIVKNIALRNRPCVKFQHLIDERKHLKVIPSMLVKVGSKASFPSGDTTGVIGFALPLATKYPTAAIVLVVVVCFGRMYFLAHHLLDTLVGCAIAYSVHLTLAELGIGMEEVQLWHLMAALALFVSVVVARGKPGYK